MPSVVVDGSDFFAVHAACREAIERGRNGGGPTAIEAVSARYYGHFEGDPQAYRDEAELRAQREAGDPLPHFLADPRTASLDAKTVAEVDAAIFAELDRTVELALAAADPTPEKLYTDVYVNYEGRAMQ
jgi:pyruvate dehydrogenase E1 component alpha subunit